MAHRFAGSRRSQPIWEHGLTCESNLAIGFSSGSLLPESLGLHPLVRLPALIAATSRNKKRLLCARLGIQMTIMAIELKIPEVGESIIEVEIGDWLKKEGEQVAKDEPVVS